MNFCKLRVSYKVLILLSIVLSFYIIEQSARISSVINSINIGVEENTQEEAQQQEEVLDNEAFIYDDNQFSQYDCRQFSKLPRTSTRPYNKLDPDKKYFTYSASGGFNNQLVEFVTAIILAKQFNRALIVPPHGKHSNLYYGFEKLAANDMIPMDTTLDFQYFEDRYGVELVPASLPIANLTALYKEQQYSVGRVSIVGERALTYNTRHYQLVTFPKRVRSLESKKIVYARGRFFTPIWILQDKTSWDVRYAPYLRQLAMKISDVIFKYKPDGTNAVDYNTAISNQSEQSQLEAVNTLRKAYSDSHEQQETEAGGGMDHPKHAQKEVQRAHKDDLGKLETTGAKELLYKSAAVHIRLGDVRDRRQGTSAFYTQFLKEKLRVKPTTILYVSAQEKRSDPYFKALRNVYHNLVFADDLVGYPLLDDALRNFEELVEGNNIRNDLFGLVEQLICIRADAFLGSQTSTFSKTIYHNRHNLKSALPELALTKTVSMRRSAQLRNDGSGTSIRNEDDQL